MKLKNHIDWIKNKSDILNSYQQSTPSTKTQPHSATQTPPNLIQTTQIRPIDPKFDQKP